MGKGSTDTDQIKGFSLGMLVGVSFVFLIIGFAGGTFTGPTVKEVLGLSNPKDNLQASADAGLESQNSEAGDAINDNALPQYEWNKIFSYFGV